MQQFLKTHSAIKDQMLHWFLKYHYKPLDYFTGQEEFTLYDMLTQTEKARFMTYLQGDEMPVYILQKGGDIIVLCTTVRFLFRPASDKQELRYTDFAGHSGYTSIHVPGHTGPIIGIKTDGYLAPFRLKKINGEILIWELPTGFSGFAFWNITNKCRIIGAKYIITGS